MTLSPPQGGYSECQSGPSTVLRRMLLQALKNQDWSAPPSSGNPTALTSGEVSRSSSDPPSWRSWRTPPPAPSPARVVGLCCYRTRPSLSCKYFCPGPPHPCSFQQPRLRRGADHGGGIVQSPIHNLLRSLSLPLGASGPWPQPTCPLISSEVWNRLGEGAARQLEHGRGPE